MSLLEDIFLQDETAEAQQLERIIEGDIYDERPRAISDSDGDSEKSDEAEEDKRRVDPTKAKHTRVVKNPRFILNPARLTGPRGIQVIPEHFKDFKFKGKGHEKEDLDLVLKKLEHWAYRLYPKFQFDDCLKKIETLGKKRPVMVHLHKIRSDQLLTEEPVLHSSDDEAPPPPEEDEFDKLLQQQIELARATPAPGSGKKGPPGFHSTPVVKNPAERALTMPKAASSPSISDEQRQRMLRNRQMAEERRLAKLKRNSTEVNNMVNKDDEVVGKAQDVVNDTNTQNDVGNSLNVVRDTNVDFGKTQNENTQVLKNNEVEDDVKGKRNKSYVIDSDDEMNENLSVDNHENNRTNKRNNLNVIDSDDEVTNAPVCIDLNEHDDGTVEDEVMIENVDVHGSSNGDDAIKSNRNKSNVIDSDDDDEFVMNEAVSVDVHDVVMRE